jgi:hypothetical protein
MIRGGTKQLGINNVVLINSDFEDFFCSIAGRHEVAPVSVYFIDGPHDYRSQLMALLYAPPILGLTRFGGRLNNPATFGVEVFHDERSEGRVEAGAAGV